MTNKQDVSVQRNNGTSLVARSSTRVDTVMPAADIYETAAGYVLMLDLPGAGKENIGITLDKGLLTVKAEATPVRDEHASVVFSEIRPKSYYRAFTIGNGVDPNNVQAQLEDGVLTVRFFKSEEQRPREIKIH